VRKRRNKHSRHDPKVVLDVEVASEIADLIADEPGTADEALLDSALASIDDAQPRRPASPSMPGSSASMKTCASGCGPKRPTKSPSSS
jgi:hypothetical protein